MAIRINNTPAPLTAIFEENLHQRDFILLVLFLIFLWKFGTGSPVFTGVALFQVVLLTLVPFGRGAIVEVSTGEVTLKKNFYGFVWRTRHTAFAEIYTLRWVPQSRPWFSRYRVPSHILVKLNGGGHFKFASTITVEEYRVLQRAIENRFPDLFQVTENAFEDNWKELA